jgi:hypothetical protein
VRSALRHADSDRTGSSGAADSHPTFYSIYLAERRGHSQRWELPRTRRG